MLYRDTEKARVIFFSETLNTSSSQKFKIQKSPLYMFCFQKFPTINSLLEGFLNKELHKILSTLIEYIYSTTTAYY